MSDVLWKPSESGNFLGNAGVPGLCAPAPHLWAPSLSSWKENLPHSKLVLIVWTEVLRESRQGEQMFNEVCEGGGWLQAVWESKPLTDV